MSAPREDVSGRVALVTGAARGIGRASTLAFAARGTSVAVCDVLDDAEETVRQIEETGGKARFLRVDVSDPQQVEAAARATVGQFGGLHFAHNNAGTFVPAPLADLAEDDWATVIAVNLTGVFLCLKYEIRHMLSAGGGAIVSTASIWGDRGAGMQAAYTASKHGVISLTRERCAS